MKFEPRLTEGNANVSKKSPVKDLFLYLGGLFGLVGLVLLVAGFLIDLVVNFLPIEYEGKIYQAASLTFPSEKVSDDADQLRVEKIFSKLVSKSDLKNFNLKIKVVEGKEENAFAYPGGMIVVHRSLVTASKSEVELAMVIGHEIGHFKNRDHFRGMGRGFLLVALSSILGFDSSTISSLIDMVGGQIQNKFSRSQELAADYYALDLLQGEYEDFENLLNFYRRIDSKLSQTEKWAHYLSTHPAPADRIKKMEQYLRERSR